MTAVDPDVAELRFVDLHGYRMAYREWGEAVAEQAVVLVHGITSSSLSWVRVAPRLATRRRVIAVDLKGHGDSDRPRTGYQLSDQADEVAGLCKVLGLSEVSLIGHSWGGGIALLLATSGDLAVQKLVLEDPAIGQRDMTADQAQTREQVAQRYINSVGVSREEAEVLARPNLALGWTEQDVAGKVDAAMKGSKEAVRAVFTDNRPWDLRDRFADLRCPTLLLRAETARGGIVDEQAVALARANPVITVLTIADADHNIHRGRFDAFMAAVEPFL
jgi:pimeloyl-ACP methyl ester carboxylesterase